MFHWISLEDRLLGRHVFLKVERLDDVYHVLGGESCPATAVQMRVDTLGSREGYQFIQGLYYVQR